MADLKNKTVFITGSSRGIGLAIGLRCAKDGANVVIVGKTAEPDPRLPGTIYSAASEIEKAGGKALPLQIDLRDETKIEEAVEKTLQTFGGIDILVNNASALYPIPTLETPMKRFDLMVGVNMRATFACSAAFIPHLKKAQNPHILNISPPINLNPKWFKDTLAYTMSKYGMSMCTLGMSAEFAQDGIAVNSLWPKYTVATIAVKAKFPDAVFKASLEPSIVSDAAYWIVTRDSRKTTGNFFLDEDLLKEHAGLTDLSPYMINPNSKPFKDFYLD